MDANGVFKRYAAGVRDFRQLDLRGISLIKADLSGVELTRKSLRNSRLLLLGIAPFVITAVVLVLAVLE